MDKYKSDAPVSSAIPNAILIDYYINVFVKNFLNAIGI